MIPPRSTRFARAVTTLRLPLARRNFFQPRREPVRRLSLEPYKILLLFISGNFSQKSNKNSSNHMLNTNYVSTRSYVRHQGLLLPAGWLALKLVSHHLETPSTFENTKVLTLLYKNIHKTIFRLKSKSADNNPDFSVKASFTVAESGH